MRIYVDFDDCLCETATQVRKQNRSLYEIFVWRHPSDSEASPYGEPLN